MTPADSKPRVRVRAGTRRLDGSGRAVLSFSKPPHPVNAEALAIARILVERVATGEFQGVAIAAVDAAGAMTTAYDWGDNGITLMGATHHLLRRVASGWQVS